MKVIRRTISFDDDIDKAVDDYRRRTLSGEPVPSFTKAVNDLLRERLKEMKFL